MYLYFTHQEQVGLLPDFSFPTDITTRSLANTLHLPQPVSAQPPCPAGPLTCLGPAEANVAEALIRPVDEAASA